MELSPRLNDIPPVPPQPLYRPLGALRFMLAMFVLVGHSTWIVEGSELSALVKTIGGGSAGVLAFFLLSGFILSEAAALFYAGRPKAFAKNRALKILPPFLVALAVSMLVHALLIETGRLPRGVEFEGVTSITSGVFAIANLAFNLLSFLPTVVASVIRKAVDERYLFVRYIWAVRVEVMFYIALGVSIWLAARKPGLARHLLAAVWGMVALAAIDRVLGPSREFQYAPYFTLGVCLFRQIGDRRFLWPGAAALIEALVHAWVFFEGALPAIAVVVLLLAVSSALCMVSAADMRWRPLDRALGDISYSLYLNQYAVLIGFYGFFPGARGFAPWLGAVAAAIAVAVLLHIVVERPLMTMRRAIRSAAAPVAAPVR